MRAFSPTHATSAVVFVLLHIVAPSGSAAQPDPDEPTLAEIPDACSYLTESAARGFLRVEGVSPSSGNEHIPTFWSQCIYGGRGTSSREVGFVFKFMIWELFDTALDPMQLEFNAQFTGGGVPPSSTLDDPGKVSFTFEDGDRTTLMMVTGMEGPPDNFGRPTEVVATYYLDDPDRPHQEKLDDLLEVARLHVAEWLARATAGSVPPTRLR